MDEFELQLKSLYEECANSGLLGHEELYELCERLELQRHVSDLADALNLNNSKCKGVSYVEFRDILIKFLGPNAESPRAGGNSPSREVSPKYVFGKKKYGRRSRPDVLDLESNLVDGVEACSVTEESSFKKRRTHEDSEIPEENVDVDKVVNSEEQMLLSAWSAVASPSGTLSKDQLVHVFQSVGLQNGSDEAASTVFEKLELGEEGITLDALLSFIKGGAPLCTDSKSQDFTENIASVEFVESPSGSITGSNLLELWEAAGVSNGREILQSLGVRPGQICDMSVLTSKLNSLISSSRESKPGSLFKAGIVLQRSYISSLKGVVDQMTKENEKLKADVSEANQRSQLLAQEVDDHHSQLEAATARQVKSLEQRHADRIRELTEQLKSDQDQLTQHSSQLELRLAGLEAEEAQAKAELSRQQAENQQLHDEHQLLVSRVAGLQAERDGLRVHVQELTLIQQRVHELEEMAKSRNVMVLLERVSGLEEENRNLRDRNDELALQVEDLSLKLNNASIHKRGSPVLNLSVDAAMREMDDLGMEQDIPIGNLCDEQGFESLRSSIVDPSIQGISPGVCMRKVKEVVHETLVNSGGIDASGPILAKLDSAWSESGQKCECGGLQETILTLREELCKVKEEDSRLKNRCKELDSSLQQLQDEYESTEDYWTSKLEEERNLFDAEQKQNDEKYSELVNKIIEYEQLMKEEVTVRQRLETIEEKDSLEKQVMEMEEEYSKLIAEKDEEINQLQQQLNSHPACVDTPAQTDLPPPQQPNSEATSSQHNYCRRSLTFTNGDRRKSCCKVYRLQGEIRNLLEAKQSAQREVAALLAERNLLYKQVLNQRREDSCSASLSSKLLCAERRCRTLMSTLRNQQLQTAELLRSTWQQHKREVEELRGVLAVTDGKLQHQTVHIQQQLNKMAAADALVKDLFVENAHLLAALRKMEAMQCCQNYSSH